MTDNWKYAIRPQFTSLFVEDMQERNRELGPKPKAFDTPFRYSDSGKCARAMSYSYFDYPGEEFDLPSTFVTSLGTHLHELVQESIGRLYPEAQFEVASRCVTTSGSADAYIELDNGEKILYELKTINGTGFKKAIGLKTRPPAISNPAGPRASAILQAAVNAKQLACDTVIIGLVSYEAISRQTAAAAGLSEIERFIAEWEIPREVWEPIADAEIIRQLRILEDLDENYLSDRFVIDDNMQEVMLAPEDSRQGWQCVYCSYSQQCLKDGPGRVPVQIGEKN